MIIKYIIAETIPNDELDLEGINDDEIESVSSRWMGLQRKLISTLTTDRSRWYCPKAK